MDTLYISKCPLIFKKLLGLGFLLEQLELTLISLHSIIYFIVTNDSLMVNETTFCLSSIPWLPCVADNNKLKEVKVRNYLHEEYEFVSRTADSVKRVPGPEHQFMGSIYPYS
jgi:hypothetical protein